MNAIAMIRRCARYGTPEGHSEPVPWEPAPPEAPSLPEEPMGHGEFDTEAQVST